MASDAASISRYENLKHISWELGDVENGNNVATMKLGLSKKNANSIIHNKFVSGIMRGRDRTSKPGIY